MSGYVVRRSAQALVVLVGVSVLVFMLIHLVPGDPVRLALGTRFDQETYEALRNAAGLNQSLPRQYLGFVAGVVTGDLGTSFRTGLPVTDMIFERLPATLWLATASVVVALVIAIPLGIISAVRRASAIDYAATVFSQAGISIPEFWMAIVLILVFSLGLEWFPPSGYVSPADDPVGFISHLAMPAVTVGVVSGSVLTRFVRSTMLESLGENYTRTARAKGLRERTVLRRHVLRNALVPVVTVTGVQLAYLLSGIVVVEIVFSWPGLGSLAFDAVQARDYPVLQGAVLLFAFFFLLLNLVVDLLYAYLDPRISYS